MRSRALGTALVLANDDSNCLRNDFHLTHLAAEIHFNRGVVLKWHHYWLAIELRWVRTQDIRR